MIKKFLGLKLSLAGNHLQIPLLFGYNELFNGKAP